MPIDHRLATYGTLAPGRVNHHQLAALRGTWRTDTVRGTLIPTGWGGDLGHPALIPNDAGEVVKVHLFESPDLPHHWPRLDDFEGDGYRRVPIHVTTPEGPIEAWIYRAAQPPI